MEKDLYIDVKANGVSIALLEDKRLVELNSEELNSSISVGDVYLGKVKKIMPALNAAFIDIGDSKDAFIHYLDLGLNFFCFDKFAKGVGTTICKSPFYQELNSEKILEKEGKIQDILSSGQSIIVQIVKEPISTKGARLTAEISIAGRNMVLLPFSSKINMSQKISDQVEKRRLERLIDSILPKNYGVIIRTAAEGKKAAVLDYDLMSLVKKWEDSWNSIVQSKNAIRLFTENTRTNTILRDLLNDSFSNIIVNDEHVFEETKDYISKISPHLDKIVKYYSGQETIFDHFDINRQIKGSFGKVVPIKKGAYIIIEHTEALHVIDVNSGTRAKSHDQEQNTFDVNMIAAEEIARQLRLRDMGGIIIIDFIDLDTNEHKNALYKKMLELVEQDRAKHTILPLTRFGLMQITRQRVRSATEIDTTESCPNCKGTGKILPSILIDEAIDRQLGFYFKEKQANSIVITTSPILKAYLNKGIYSIKNKWLIKYKKSISIVSNTNFGVLQFEIQQN